MTICSLHLVNQQRIIYNMSAVQKLRNNQLLKINSDWQTMTVHQCFHIKKVRASKPTHTDRMRYLTSTVATFIIVTRQCQCHVSICRRRKPLVAIEFIAAVGLFHCNRLSATRCQQRIIILSANFKQNFLNMLPTFNHLRSI